MELAETSSYSSVGFTRGRLAERKVWFPRLLQPESVLPHDLPALAGRLEWDRAPNQLLIGDLSSLDPDDALTICNAAANPELADLADRLNLDPIVLVIALMARMQSSRSRSAARRARAILPDETAWREIEAVVQRLGII